MGPHPVDFVGQSRVEYSRIISAYDSVDAGYQQAMHRVLSRVGDATEHSIGSRADLDHGAELFEGVEGEILPVTNLCDSSR